MKLYIVYAGTEPVASSSNKKEAIRKAKEAHPNKVMVGVLRNMRTCRDSNLFYVNTKEA